MVKRPFNQANVDGQDRRQGTTPKKQKKDDSRPTKGLAPESITSARQLQGLFAEYSNAAKVQAGVQSFKRFLAECRDLQYALHVEEEVKLCLLHEYLEAQISQDGDETCNDLMQAWSFASQSNNFQLLSSVPTAIHLLLRTVSLFPAWKKHGVALTKTVLQPSYLKTIYRSIGGPKDAISSPCLRLLTEINKFDNGSLCSYLHQAVDFTVKDLARNLEIKKADKTTQPAAEDPDRPSVRTVFVRFILSFFQHGTPNIKADIMGVKAFTTPLFKHIRQDTAALINEVLDTFETHVISDLGVARGAKTNYFNDWSLSRLAELCYREDIVDPKDTERTVADVAYVFLENVCTATGNGVCFKDNGWYTGAKVDPAIDTKTGKAQVNNRILLGLLKSLRPYSNTYHLRLLVAIFKSSPELVAAYFTDTTAFAFDPKLTATWIGLSSVFLETIQIEVPALFGFSGSEMPSVPPPVRNMIESIIPQQLTRAVLTKCLTYNNNLVRFFCMRILNAAFSKLAQVLDMLSTLSADFVDATAWVNAAHDLLDEFSKRVPELPAIITAFNQVPQDGALQREAASRLLLNYHELLPSLAPGKFDFGHSFSQVLARIDQSTGFESLEVLHCLHLAKLLPETRWWAKTAAASYSPAVTLMKITVERGQDTTAESGNRREVYNLLKKIMDDSPLFGRDERSDGSDTSGHVVHPLEALIESLEFARDAGSLDSVLGYLDNACGRLVQSPYKFYDIIGEMLEASAVGNRQRTLSPLLAALFHQFNFVKRGKEWSSAQVEGLSRWLLRVSRNLWVVGEMAMVPTNKGDNISAAVGAQNSGEVFTQFTQGVQTWRRCLEEFKIRNAAEDWGWAEFAVGTGSLLSSKVTRELRMQSLRYIKGVIQAAIRPAGRNKADKALPISLFLWRSLQLVVEVLLQIAQSSEQVEMDEKELLEFGQTRVFIFDAYTEAARLFLQNPAYDPETRGKLCAAAMLDSSGTLLYVDYLCRSMSLPSYEQCDIALIRVYGMLPLGSLADPRSVKHGLKTTLARAYGYCGGDDHAQPYSTDRLELFTKLVLNNEDLKFLGRDTNLNRLHLSGGTDPKFLSSGWGTAVQKLSDAKETLAGHEVWGFIGAAPFDQARQPLDLLDLAERLLDEEALKNIRMSTEVIFKAVSRPASPKGFQPFVEQMILAGDLSKGLTTLLDIVSERVASLTTGWDSKKEVIFGNILELTVAVVKSVAMEKDNQTGRLRWKHTNNEEHQRLGERFFNICYEAKTPEGRKSVKAWQYFLSRDHQAAEYFEVGLDFDHIPCNKEVQALIQSDGDDPLNLASFGLFQAIYRAAGGSHWDWFGTRIRSMVRALTSAISQPKSVLETTKHGIQAVSFCELFADFLQRAGPTPAKDAMDSLLEALFERLDVGKGVVLLAAVSLQYLMNVEHSKLLQLVLSSTTTALSRRRTPAAPLDEDTAIDRYRLVYITRKLFSASKYKHSNVTTLDGILALYGGTNDPVDAVLLEILITIEGRMSKSIMDRITSVSFSDAERKDVGFIERDSKGRITVNISEATLATSMAHYQPRGIDFNNPESNDDEEQDALKQFLETCSEFDTQNEMRGCTYDVGFISMLLMQGVTTEKNELRLDVGDMIEKGALGYVVLGLASENAEERGMAEAVITAVVSKLESSAGSGKGRGYKARTEVTHLLCKILAGIAALAEEDAADDDDDEDEDEDDSTAADLRHQGIPTVTATILADLLAVVARPTHFLYEKTMRWLQARACIDLREVPMLRELLRSEAENRWREVIWLLERLARGMKRAADVEICRRRGVFEEILSVYTLSDVASSSKAAVSSSSAVAGRGVSAEKLVRLRVVAVLWGAAGLSAGATTLVTRTGVLSWARVVMCSPVTGDEERLRLKRLVARLWEVCDTPYVLDWSSGNIARVGLCL
ncbi:hypothetical protein DRE_00810 [Drechslerella stenobrocha 248]|uniref:Nucleolar pre-ribosomal-associated protein 1 N-terminal domain-containing protein n=1 Tax=Drechslerella stenobrocha 248 TaxID=1043628 RepID=W7HMZ8_9PEZI|nr:hypothetical protein DRE_00810 [Drechslerella stenobrocha 248]